MVLFNPVVRGVRHVHVALGHNSYQVLLAQFVGEILSDTQKNDDAVKVTAREEGKLILAASASSLRWERRER